MTAVQIIEEIKRLPSEEQARVIEFAQEAGESRPLTPDELGQLAKRMVETKDPRKPTSCKSRLCAGSTARGHGAVDRRGRFKRGSLQKRKNARQKMTAEK